MRAGGITDIGARVICEQLGQVLGRPVIVENRPGGGTRIGTSAAFAAKPDGNTLLLTNIAYSILPLVDPSVKYDARDGGCASGNRFGLSNRAGRQRGTACENLAASSSTMPAKIRES